MKAQSLNSDVEIKWGYTTFSEKLYMGDHCLRIRPQFLNYAATLVRISNWKKFINSQKDLIPVQDQTDEEDIGTVKVFSIKLKNSSVNLVSKLIRKDRVPSIFHEALICHVLNERGIHVPDVIAVLEAQSASMNNYILMKQIPNSYSLLQIYNNPQRLKELLIYATRYNPIDIQLNVDPINIAYTFGAETYKLFRAGVVHDELDLKNVCLSITNKLSFFFLDFERTRIVLSRPSSRRIVAAYTESIPRRIARYKLSEDYLQSFADGYISANSTINSDEIIDVLLKLHHKKRPLIIGIDGFAGAGKTFLAQKIASQLFSLT